MRSLQILAAGFLVLMTGCQAREPEPAAAKRGPQAVAPKPVVDTSRAAVLAYDEERDQYIFENVKAAALLPEEVARVDTLLAASVEAHNQAQVAELGDMREIMHKYDPKVRLHEERYYLNLANYKRQLIVVTNAQGEKIVWVNCFCREGSQASWRHQIIEVVDGGNCYFNIKLNLTRRIWYDMMINGVA